MEGLLLSIYSGDFNYIGIKKNHWFWLLIGLKMLEISKSTDKNIKVLSRQQFHDIIFLVLEFKRLNLGMPTIKAQVVSTKKNKFDFH